MEGAIEDRAVNFAQVGGGRFVLDADDDAIGVEEVLDGGAFAEEFGIGGDAERDVGVSRVRGQGAAQFETGARGNGALFDDELGGLRFLGDLAGDVVDRGKVGFAIAFWRRAHADENGIAEANGFSGVGSVGNVAA